MVTWLVRFEDPTFSFDLRICLAKLHNFAWYGSCAQRCTNLSCLFQGQNVQLLYVLLQSSHYRKVLVQNVLSIANPKISQLNSPKNTRSKFKSCFQAWLSPRSSPFSNLKKCKRTRHVQNTWLTRRKMPPFCRRAGSGLEKNTLQRALSHIDVNVELCWAPHYSLSQVRIHPHGNGSKINYAFELEKRKRWK